MKKLLLTLGLAKLGTSDDDDQSAAYGAASTVAAIGAGIATRTAIKSLWKRTTGNEPPNDPADPTVAWKEALAWAAATGVGVGVARVVGRRLAADVWEKRSGKPAPAERETSDA